jgi:hypothetical protein
VIATPRRLFGALALPVVVAVVVVVAGLAPPVAAQTSGATEPSYTVQLESQSAFVRADEAFTLRLKITGAEPGDQIKVDVWGQKSELATRDQLRTAIEAGDPADADLVKLRRPYSFVYEQVLDPATGDVVLTIPADNVIDEPGVYPLTVRIEGRGADPRLTTTLIRLGDVDETVGPLDVAFVVPVTGEVAHRPDGSIALGADDGERLGALASLFTGALGSFPLTLEPSPETLDAIAAGSNAGNAGDDALLNQLRALATPRHLLGGTYVPVDDEGLRAADLDLLVGDLHNAGARAIRDSGLGTIDTSIALAGGSDTPETLTMRQQYGGAQYLLFPNEALEPLDDEEGTAPLLQSFVVEDRQGTPVGALATDTYLTELAAALDDRRDEAPLLAQRFLADLVAGYRDDPETVRGAAVVLPADWDVTGASVVGLLEALQSVPELHPTTAEDLLARVSAAEPAAGRGEAASGPLVRQLRSAEPTDLGNYPAQLARTDRELRGFESITGTANGPQSADLERLRLVSADERLDGDERSAYLDAIDRGVRTRLLAPDGGPGFLGPGTQRVTMTSRRATIPIQIENRLGFPANVRMELQSEKLSFPEGWLRETTLAPGSNTIEVEVEAKTSGDSLLEVTILPPDAGSGLGTLTEGSFTVRSTALSGVGLVISIIALCVLLVWWARHVLRTRRARREGPPTDPPPRAPEAPHDVHPVEATAPDAAPTPSLTRTES